MKKILFLSTLALSTLLWSCSGDQDQAATDPSSSNEEAEQSSETEASEAAKPAAEEVEFVCSCETSLKVKKGEDWGWGSKVLTWQDGVLTGDTVTIQKKEYSEVKLVDGSVGFLNNWCVVKDAKRGVMISDATIYKKPDVMALSDVKITAGEFIAVGNEEIGGYKEVTYKAAGKKKSGWIKASANKYSFEDMDLAVAKMISQAEKLEGEAKAAALQNILDNSDFAESIFYKKLMAEQSAGEAVEEYEENMDDMVTDDLDIDDSEVLPE